MEPQSYNFVAWYTKGNQMFIADTIKRAYLPTMESDYDTDQRVRQFSTQHDFKDKQVHAIEISISDERLQQIKEATANDA